MGFYNRFPMQVPATPGAIAVCQLPCSATYDKIRLKLGGTPGHVLVAADILRVEIKANGSTVFVITGTRLDLMQAYKTVAVDAAYLTIDFTEPHSRGGAAGQYLASIPANLLKTLTVEITVDAGADAAGTMEVHAEYRNPTQNPFIRKLRDFALVLPITGENQVILPVGIAGGLITRGWFFTAGGKITAWDLIVNNRSARKQAQADWDFEQKANGMTKQVHVDVMDFVADGNMASALNTAGDGKGGNIPSVDLRITTSGAETGTGYLEYIDPIGRL